MIEKSFTKCTVILRLTMISSYTFYKRKVISFYDWSENKQKVSIINVCFGWGHLNICKEISA